MGYATRSEDDNVAYVRGAIFTESELPPAARLFAEDLSNKPTAVMTPTAALGQHELVHPLFPRAPTLDPVPEALTAFGYEKAALQLCGDMAQEGAVSGGQQDAPVALELPEVHAPL